MPYAFPYEDLFVGLIAALIIGLLLIRIAVSRRLRREGQDQPKNRD
jgi:hypothetical protein